jgi:murein DD-endopeptidase MepM/ murein hydrolase activator NlpD
MKHSFSLLAMATILASCTQSPVEVVDKGSMSFGRNGQNQLASAAPVVVPRPEPGYISIVENHPQESAAVASVSTSDLPPPAPVSSAPLADPRTTSAPASMAVPTSVASQSLTSPVASPASPPMAASAPASTGSSVSVSETAPLPVQTVDTVQAAPVTAPTAPSYQNDYEQTMAALQTAPSTTTDTNKASGPGFIWPVRGEIISTFGPKGAGKSNDGINIAAAEGEPIKAAADGQVVYAGNQLKGYGNMIIIRHSGDWVTAYAHAKDILVRDGDNVVRGQVLGSVGNTGGVGTAQLHFGIRQGKKPVDPLKMLPENLAMR